MTQIIFGPSLSHIDAFARPQRLSQSAHIQRSFDLDFAHRQFYYKCSPVYPLYSPTFPSAEQRAQHAPPPPSHRLSTSLARNLSDQRTSYSRDDFTGTSFPLFQGSLPTWQAASRLIVLILHLAQIALAQADLIGHLTAFAP